MKSTLLKVIFKFCTTSKLFINFFQQNSFSLIEMLIFLKLFISCLSRKVVRIKSAGKKVAIRKGRAMIGWKRIAERASFVFNLWAVQDFFLSAEGGVRSFDKSGFKSRQMKAEWKKFYKKLISYCIFFNNKKCFPLNICKVF